jgi:hypothetical protein
VADLVFNIAKGRAAQLAINVDTGSPANSRLILHAFDATGAVEDDIRNADTIAAVEAVTNVTERVTGGWVRKTLTSTDVTVTTDDTNDRVDVDIPDQTWTAVSTGAVTRLMFSYDPDSTAGTDADLVPLTSHDFAITPDGSDVTAQIATAGFYRAQ